MPTLVHNTQSLDKEKGRGGQGGGDNRGGGGRGENSRCVGARACCCAWREGGVALLGCCSPAGLPCALPAQPWPQCTGHQSCPPSGGPSCRWPSPELAPPAAPPARAPGKHLILRSLRQACDCSVSLIVSSCCYEYVGCGVVPGSTLRHCSGCLCNARGVKGAAQAWQAGRNQRLWNE